VAHKKQRHCYDIVTRRHISHEDTRHTHTHTQTIAGRFFREIERVAGNKTKFWTNFVLFSFFQARHGDGLLDCCSYFTDWLVTVRPYTYAYAYACIGAESQREREEGCRRRYVPTRRK
jgi:hypothetical protein